MCVRAKEVKFDNKSHEGKFCDSQRLNFHSQVGIFGPPQTLYQGGYFKVGNRDFPFFIERHSTQIRCFRHETEKKSFCNELFQGPRSVFVVWMFISRSLYFSALVPLNDDTSSVLHMRTLRKRTNNKQRGVFTVNVVVINT